MSLSRGNIYADTLGRAKDEAKKQGGTIGHEYSLIKGFQ